MAEYLPALPRKLTDGDKEFIKLIEEGKKKAPSFRAAYPEHPLVVQWNETPVGSPAHQQAMEGIVQSAKVKLQAKYIRRALVSYESAMEEYQRLSIETAIELVKNAQSEKVRADLAIEGIRHKVGSPTTKVQVQEKKTVYLSFGPAPDASKIPEGLVVVPHVLDESNGTAHTDTPPTSQDVSPAPEDSTPFSEDDF